jgi:hypothetical protein
MVVGDEEKMGMCWGKPRFWDAGTMQGRQGLHMFLTMPNAFTISLTPTASSSSSWLLTVSRSTNSGSYGAIRMVWGVFGYHCFLSFLDMHVQAAV